MVPSVPRQLALDVDGALDAVGGPVEGHKETIARVPDILAAMLGEGRPQLAIVPTEELGPGLVSDQANEVGGRDDVREHECLRDALGRLGGRAPVVTQKRIDALQVQGCAEPLERGAGGSQIAPRGRGIALGGDGFGKVQAGVRPRTADRSPARSATTDRATAKPRRACPRRGAARPAP